MGSCSACSFPAYAYKLIRGLTEARAHAEETARAKSQFLASVSHEFRTPLNAVIGLGDLLANSTLPPTELSWARTIAVAGRSLLDQINSILDFSRLEAGQLPLAHEPFDVIALASDARDMLAAQARAKSLAFGLHVHMPVMARVVASPRLLRDALVNLLANAIRFTPSGYVVLTITPISRTPRSQTLRFEVIDSGIGIEAVALDRIFDRFAQADASIADRFGGTGLGLAIVKQLVAAMNGHLGVSSKVGRGSRFWFEIPLELDLSDVPREADLASPLSEADGIVSPLIETKDDRLHRHDPGKFLFLLTPDASARERDDALVLANRYRRLRVDHPSPPAHAGNPLRILVAEDNATNQMVIERVLAGAGHRVVLVEDGRAALVALASKPFNVVLMDLNMPVLNGYEASCLYRERTVPEARVPIVVLTADATEETRVRCLAAGIADCLTKPIEPPRLLAAITRIGGATLDPIVRTGTQPMTKPEWCHGLDALNPSALAMLGTLGGDDFVREIVLQFSRDAADLLASITAAGQRRDLRAVRDDLHALRSCANHVGADGVTLFCKTFEGRDDAHLLQDMASEAATLQPMLDDLRHSLARDRLAA